MRILLTEGYIHPNDRILDYGCGKGADVLYLRSLGYDVEGYDPYQPSWDNPEVLIDDYYDVILNFYVLNVVPIEERISILNNIYDLLTYGGRAYITVRDISERKYLHGTPYTDGVITSKGTFQKLFSPEELVSFIGEHTEFSRITTITNRQPLLVEVTKW